MIVSYDAYRVFYTVARFGSFTKAASVAFSCPCWAHFIGRIRAFVCAFPIIPRRRRLLR